MKINKMIAFALACTLAAGAAHSLMPVCASASHFEREIYGNEIDRNEVNKAKAEALKRAEIPKEYTEFSCKAYREYDNVFYDLIWEKKYGIISVGYYKGLIYGYSANAREDYSKPSFVTNTQAEQEKIAYEHICRLNPDMRGKFELVRQSDYYTLSRWAEYRIYRVENGLAAYNSGGIIIDRSSGELIEFFLDDWYMGVDFPDGENALTMEQALGIYSENANVTVKYELYYNSEYDPDSRTLALYPYILPVYRIRSNSPRIDGVTGEPSAYEDDRRQADTCELCSWGKYGNEDIIMCTGGYEGGEITDIDEDDIALYEKSHDSGKFITAKKAGEILKGDGVIVFDGSLSLKDEKITYDRDGNGAVRALRYVEYEYAPKNEPRDKISLWAELDAFSGEITAFGKKYYYNDRFTI